MALTYRGGIVWPCEGCGRPVVVFRYEDFDEQWAQLFEYECSHCGKKVHEEDPYGWDVHYKSPLYSSEEKGEAGCRCPGCGTDYTARLLSTTEYIEDHALRRFETLFGTCPACGLGYDARRDGMDLGFHDESDEMDIRELEGGK